jgi:hypothetical protein
VRSNIGDGSAGGSVGIINGCGENLRHLEQHKDQRGKS